MHSRTGGIERELADRNAHAVGAQIAEPQDTLAVGDDDELRRIGPVGENFGDVSAIFGANKQSARPLEYVPEPLTGKAHRRRIDERLNLVDIVANDPEK